MKQTSTYNSIVKFHDEYMIAIMGSSRYQKYCKIQAQLTSTISRIHHTGMKIMEATKTHSQTKEQCGPTNQKCQFTKNANRSMDKISKECTRQMTQYHGSVSM